MGSKWRVFRTFSLFLFVFLILQFYIGIHGWWYFSLLVDDLSKLVYWGIFSFIALAYILVHLTRNVLPYSLARIIKYIGAYWLAVFEYGVILLPITDVIALILYWCSVPLDFIIQTLGSMVLVVLLGILIMGSWSAWVPTIRRIEIKLGKQAGSLQQLRVAVASDLHLGMIVGNRHIKRLIRSVDKINPDLILLVGDVLDDEIKPFIQHKMAETLRGLTAPMGVFAVVGNHEYIGKNVDEYVKRMEEIGIKVLLDESELVHNVFYVVGRKDRAVKSFGNGTRVELDQLIAPLDHTKPIILMDHQPYKLDEAAEAGVDLMLSGHTHRGQLAPNHLITRRIFELDWGYLKKGSMHAIVSSGFGTWGPPIRIGSRSEVVDITIYFD